MNLKQQLIYLRDTAAAARLAQQRVDDAVAVLRSPDSNGYCLASWQEIADAIGGTRQGVTAYYRRRGL